jgi:hypothetical protein
LGNKTREKGIGLKETEESIDWYISRFLFIGTKKEKGIKDEHLFNTSQFLLSKLFLAGGGITYVRASILSIFDREMGKVFE